MQLTFDVPDFPQQVFTPEQQAAKSELERAAIADTEFEIEEKLEEIERLKKEIRDDEEALLNCLEAELDLEPEPGEEVIFDCSGPIYEEDLNQTRAENEPEISRLESEIEELKAELERLKSGGQ